MFFVFFFIFVVLNFVVDLLCLVFRPGSGFPRATNVVVVGVLVVIRYSKY